MSRARQHKPKSKPSADTPPVRHAGREPARPMVFLAGLMLVVAFVVIVVYWPALSAKALSFDDDQYMTRNALVQQPSWTSAGRFLGEVLQPSTVGGYYQPLTMISLMLDYAVAGSTDNLRPFHRTSLALHVLNTLLVIVLLHMLFGRPWVAAMVGLLFGVHPVTVEPIPWIGERKTLLAAFFSLWCLVLYVRYARTASWKYYGLCLLMYVLALMSKPTSTPLPVVMLLLDAWPLRRLSWRSVLEKVPFFVIAGISANITVISQKRTGAVVMPGEYPLMRAPFIVCHNIIFYPFKLLWPVNLTSHYAFPEPFDLSNGKVLAGVVGTCLVIPLLLISLRWTRALLTGWLIFLVTVFPTMNIIGFSDVIASDKFAYLPSIGFLMILAWVVGRFVRKEKQLVPSARRSWVVMAVVILLAGAEARATRHQLTYWRDTQSLYTHMISLAPRVAVLYPTVGYWLHMRGLPEQAIEAYRTAIWLNPGHRFASHTNYLLGNVLLERGRPAEAAACYEEAIRRKPDSPDVYHNLGDIYNNLGVALSKLNKNEEAVQVYKKALEIDGRNLGALNNLSILLADQGKIDEAAACYEKILRIQPRHDGAHDGLATILARQGKMDEAVKHFKMALEINPRSYGAHMNLALTLARQKDIDGAIQEFGKALEIKPQDVEGRYSLATLLGQRGRIDEAIREYRRVLQMNPQHAGARQGLAALLAKKGP